MKLRKLFAGIMALLLVVCLSSCGWSFEPTPLLYKVTDTDGDVVWLFGSIHVATDNLYPLPDYVMDAFNASDALAVECNTLALEDDLAAAQQELMRAMMYTDGTTIADHIDKEVYDSAVAILEENDYYDAVYDGFMPILWSTNIENICVSKWGYDGDIGIDVHLMETAQAQGKEIREIESVEAQYTMLANFSPALQEMLLEQSIASYDSPMGRLSFTILANAWKSGDAETLSMLASSATTEDMSEKEIALHAEYNKAMMTDRNVLMADYAEDALQKGDDVFICVGAAHVVGNGGIADLLTERGYTVETVTPSAEE